MTKVLWHGSGQPPATIPAQVSQWATLIPARTTQQFKVHSHLGLAKTALRVHEHRDKFTANMALYELVEDNWVLRLHITRDTKPDDYMLWQDSKAFQRGMHHIIDEAVSLGD